MESRKCKNKNCQKPLPEAYKYKYCENCRNEYVKQVKNVGKTLLALVGTTAIAVVTKGRIDQK